VQYFSHSVILQPFRIQQYPYDCETRIAGNVVYYAVSRMVENRPIRLILAEDGRNLDEGKAFVMDFSKWLGGCGGVAQEQDSDDESHINQVK
jgi:hypothetical protein